MTELVGRRVVRTAFERQVWLTFAGAERVAGERVAAELVIETPFQLFGASAGGWVSYQPGTASGLAQLLDLFGVRVSLDLSCVGQAV
jgi:hypothetical protein